MTAVALYTFGLLDPELGDARLDDFVRRGGRILAASDDAPGFLGRPEKPDGATETHAPGEDYGRWGLYALPDVPQFGDRDPHAHIATLSLWRSVDEARAFVYGSPHRDALRIRYDWFLKGDWPGYVLWRVPDGVTPRWTDGVSRYETLARAGESADRFSFPSRWARS